MTFTMIDFKPLIVTIDIGRLTLKFSPTETSLLDDGVEIDIISDISNSAYFSNLSLVDRTLVNALMLNDWFDKDTLATLGKDELSKVTTFTTARFLLNLKYRLAEFVIAVISLDDDSYKLQFDSLNGWEYNFEQDISPAVIQAAINLAWSQAVHMNHFVASDVVFEDDGGITNGKHIFKNKGKSAAIFTYLPEGKRTEDPGGILGYTNPTLDPNKYTFESLSNYRFVSRIDIFDPLYTLLIDETNRAPFSPIYRITEHSPSRDYNYISIVDSASDENNDASVVALFFQVFVQRSHLDEDRNNSFPFPKPDIYLGPADEIRILQNPLCFKNTSIRIFKIKSVTVNTENVVTDIVAEESDSSEILGLISDISNSKGLVDPDGNHRRVTPTLLP